MSCDAAPGSTVHMKLSGVFVQCEDVTFATRQERLYNWSISGVAPGAFSRCWVKYFSANSAPIFSGLEEHRVYDLGEHQSITMGILAMTCP